MVLVALTEFPEVDAVYPLVFVIYAGLIGGILLMVAVPQVHQLLLYGKCGTNRLDTKQFRLTSWWSRLTVPKLSFTHYYVSLFGYCSAIWWTQRWWQPQTITLYDHDYSDGFRCITIVFRLMWFHLIRRVLECFLITKFSPTSRMNVAHYLLGMLHYLLLAVHTACSLTLLRPYANQANMTPTTSEYVLIGLFVLASLNQCWCHWHLALLVKYSIPKFWYTTSAHYTNEIELYVIWFILAVKLAVPTPYIWANYAIIATFVTVNLLVSLLQTYRYYREKFGPDLGLQYAIIPGFL